MWAADFPLLLSVPLIIGCWSAILLFLFSLLLAQHEQAMTTAAAPCEPPRIDRAPPVPPAGSGELNPSFLVWVQVRLGGLILTAASWVAGHKLYELANQAPAHPASVVELTLGAMTFLFGSVGAALLIEGLRLFEPCEAPRVRRTTRL
jgi:hypothetical protein